jgi:hypothetical protein
VLTGAQWRDSWLHDFRSLYLMMEVILLGLAGGLLVSILTLEVSRPWVPALLLIVDATGSLLLLARMRVAAARLGDDVRFWRREIVRAERELPPERRVFTRFKPLQRSRTNADTDELAGLALSATGLDEIALDRLVEPFSATRRLIENRVPTLIAVLSVSWALGLARGTRHRTAPGIHGVAESSARTRLSRSPRGRHTHSPVLPDLPCGATDAVRLTRYGRRGMAEVRKPGSAGPRRLRHLVSAQRHPW